MATADSSNDDSATETATDDASPPSDRPPTDEEKKAATQRAAKAKVARLRAELAAAEEECTSLADDGDGDGAGQPSSEEQETLDENADDDPPPAATTARLGRTAVSGGIHQIAAAARAATGKKSPDQIVGALAALGRTQGVLTALQRRVAELEAKTRRDEVSALVSAAVKQGRLTPAEREWALSYGMESPEKLRGYLDVTPSRATLAGTELREPRRGAGAVALSEVERKICQNAGLDPEKFALAKQRPVRTSTGGT